MDCELLGTCGFFQKYSNSLDMACRGFIKTFCKGGEMEKCARKLYRAEHGTPPEDDMMPSGQMMPQIYKI